MNAKKPALPRSLKSDLERVNAHIVNDVEYDDLPELDEAMLAGGRSSGAGVRSQPIRASCFPSGYLPMSSTAGRPLARAGRPAWLNDSVRFNEQLNLPCDSEGQMPRVNLMVMPGIHLTAPAKTAKTSRRQNSAHS